jgi:hypothetical protein
MAWRATAALLMLATAGCASPPTQFYTLTAAGAPATPAASWDRAVSVGPVAVPAAVDRPEIVVTVGPNQLWLDEFNRWAAPLQSTLARVVAQNLVAQLGTARVTAAPQTLGLEADYRVAIEVQGFTSAPGEAATLDALWRVSRVRDGQPLTGRTTVREPIAEAGYGALAAAHSRALARLSRDIAAAVQSLDGAAGK